MIGNIYLVGGAVRDKILNTPSHDRDWVVTGSSPENLLAAGFTPVGADFPVFLHPETKEEYALARTERKTGAGHKGFDVYFDQSVTLEEDLSRRDLTINSIAMDSDGNFIDPFNGQEDLKNGILKHVGVAFSEDPLRILRVARFNAKFPTFTVHPATTTLMKTMVANGALTEISGERLFNECVKALSTSAPWKFFETLHDVGGDEIVFGGSCDVLNIQKALSMPGVSSLPPEWIMALAFSRSGLSQARLESTAIRQKWPNDFSQSLRLVSFLESSFMQPPHDGAKLYQLAKQADAFRRPERFIQFLQAIKTQTDIDITPIINAVSAVKNIHLEAALANVPNHKKNEQADRLKCECFSASFNQNKLKLY